MERAPRQPSSEGQEEVEKLSSATLYKVTHVETHDDSADPDRLRAGSSTPLKRPSRTTRYYAEVRTPAEENTPADQPRDDKGRVSRRLLADNPLEIGKRFAPLYEKHNQPTITADGRKISSFSIQSADGEDMDKLREIWRSSEERRLRPLDDEEMESFYEGMRTTLRERQAAKSERSTRATPAPPPPPSPQKKPLDGPPPPPPPPPSRKK